jgi:dihydrolipoamide dehydrogenase
MGRKDKVVADFTKGIEFLFRKNKVTWLKGLGRLTGKGKVEVLNDGKGETISAKHIIIATGSDVTPLRGVEIDEKQVVTSTGALALEKVPEHLIVIGGGVIGLELGSVWRRLGSEVLVVEYLDRILPGMDNEVGRQFQRILEKQGFQFKLSSKVTKVEANGQGATVTVEPAAGGSPETIQADAVLVSIGRVPYTEGLGLEHVGVQKDNKGRILTDAHFATNVTGIYAIGDVIAGPMLAHKAEDEGVAVAEILAGRAGHVNYDVIPNVVYTFPEVASVGKTEEELKQDGVAYKVGKFPFTANGRAKVNRMTDGFVKILADATTDRVLGVHIVGPEAGNLVMECAVAMEFGASSEDIARTCHAHPTLTEAVKEAALAVDNRAIHM